MVYTFEKQQIDFLKVFKTFDFKDNFLVSSRFTCDYYRGDELSAILNRMPLEFVVTIFCDALMNSALWSAEASSLYNILDRHHFTYNNYNIFEPSANITNQFPQYFFLFWKEKIPPDGLEKIYSTVRMYFIKFFSDLSKSLGYLIASTQYFSLLTDTDLRYNQFGIDDKVIEAYQSALEDAVIFLGIKMRIFT